MEDFFVLWPSTWADSLNLHSVIIHHYHCQYYHCHHQRQQ